jgi:hypothetical protein
MPLVTTLSVRLDYELTKALDLVSPRAQSAFAKALALASGIGANQADKFFIDSRHITGVATDSLDLAGGALTDALGDAFSLGRLKGMLVYARATNPNPIEVRKPASGAPWGTGNVIVRPGGLFTLWALDATSYVVTAGTGDLLEIANTVSGDADYDICLVGASS